jgi:hypothetical protein
MINRSEGYSFPNKWLPTGDSHPREEYLNSPWVEIMKRLENVQVYINYQGYLPVDDVSKRKPKQVLHAAHFQDWFNWMRQEGHTRSWEDAWTTWRAMGKFYNTIPTPDLDVVNDVISHYENLGGGLILPAEDEIQGSSSMYSHVGYAVEHTYVDHYERKGTLWPETEARIYWIDWVQNKGHEYSHFNKMRVLNVLEISLLSLSELP